MSLYIHIPFCHAKCAYCDFYSMPQQALAPRYVAAVAAEWRQRRGELPGEPTTLYLGGGTPSALAPELLERLVASLEIDTSALREFTIEVNPEDVSTAAINSWLRMGVNRVSMGVQSFVDAELRVVGRRHTAAEAINAARLLRSQGISNISLDLIYGLPGQTLDSWQRSLDQLIELAPEHFSAYSLTYEPRTRLTAMLKRGDITAVDDDVVAEMYSALTRRACEGAYSHYEISNFCREGYRAVHNSRYWTGVAYLGLGPSAHSYDGAVRRYNPSSLQAWLQAIEAGKPACEVDDETPVDRVNDLIITSLRTAEGLAFERLPRRYRRRFLIDAYPHLEAGRLEARGTTLVIPERHWLLADLILRDLIRLPAE